MLFRSGGRPVGSAGSADWPAARALGRPAKRIASVRAAGGRVTDLTGEPLVYNRRESLRADNFIAAADPSVNFASLLNMRDA